LFRIHSAVTKLNDEFPGASVEVLGASAFVVAALKVLTGSREVVEAANRDGFIDLGAFAPVYPDRGELVYLKPPLPASPARAELRHQRLAEIDFSNLPAESVARLTRIENAIHGIPSESPLVRIFSNVFFHDGLWTNEADMYDVFERLGALGVTTNQSIAQKKADTWKPYIRELWEQGLSSEDSFLLAYHREARVPFEALAGIRAQFGAIGNVSQEASALITDRHSLVRATNVIDGLFGQAGSLVKLPNISGSLAGLPNVREDGPLAAYDRILDGRSGNITLGFSVDHFLAFAVQHVFALEMRAEALAKAGYTQAQIQEDFSRINWVFSLFESRIDRLAAKWFDEAIAKAEAEGNAELTQELRLLKGKTAVALGRLAGQVMQAVYFNIPLTNGGEFLSSGQVGLIHDLNRRFRLIHEKYGARPLYLLIASSGKYDDQPYATPLQYVLPFLGSGVWNTLPPAALKALSEFAANPMRNGGRFDVEMLQERNLVQEQIPFFEQPQEINPAAYEAWDEAILLTRGEREARGIPSESASRILARTEELLLSKRANPSEQSFRAVGNERRDGGARDFEKAERQMLGLIGGWRQEFEAEKQQRAELRNAAISSAPVQVKPLSPELSAKVQGALRTLLDAFGQNQSAGRVLAATGFEYGQGTVVDPSILFEGFGDLGDQGYLFAALAIREVYGNAPVAVPLPQPDPGDARAVKEYEARWQLLNEINKFLAEEGREPFVVTDSVSRAVEVLRQRFEAKELGAVVGVDSSLAEAIRRQVPDVQIMTQRRFKSLVALDSVYARFAQDIAAFYATAKSA
jgi:hypothetical protein